MKTLDVTEILKSKFNGKSIVHKPTGATMYDGLVRTWTDASGTWTCIYEIGYGNLDFIGVEIEYETLKPSSELPTILPSTTYFLDNYLNIADKKEVRLVLSYSESVNASTSNTITEGQNSTFKTDANFNIGVFGKVSTGYSKVISLSTQSSKSTSVTKTKGKTETFDFSYEVPPKSSIIIKLTKDLRNYEIPFKAKMIIDGEFFIIGTYTHNLLTNRQPIDKGWGKISDYLSEEERTLTVNGLIEEIVGESTRRSVRIKPLTNENDLSKFDILVREHFSIENGIKRNTAEITLSSITAFDNGDFDVTFIVNTGVCNNSACAGFDATLLLELDDDIYSEVYSFEGWTIADGNSSYFSITRQGNRLGLLRDVTNIEIPDIVCDDES